MSAPAFIPIECYGSYDEESEVVPVGAVESWQVAGQILANNSGCYYVYTGLTTTGVQECECTPTHDADGRDTPGGYCDHAGTACVVRQNVRCWGFVGYDDLLDAQDDAELPEYLFAPERAS